jgi:hypothetical protein
MRAAKLKELCDISQEETKSKFKENGLYYNSFWKTMSLNNVFYIQIILNSVN